MEPLAAASKAPPTGVPQPARSRQSGDECDFVCAAHGVPVECTERHGHLLQHFSIPAVSRVGTDAHWMNRFRRILVRWEKLPETFIAMLHLTCVVFITATLPAADQ